MGTLERCFFSLGMKKKREIRAPASHAHAGA